MAFITGLLFAGVLAFLLTRLQRKNPRFVMKAMACFAFANLVFFAKNTFEHDWFMAVWTGFGIFSSFWWYIDAKRDAEVQELQAMAERQ